MFPCIGADWSGIFQQQAPLVLKWMPLFLLRWKHKCTLQGQKNVALCPARFGAYFKRHLRDGISAHKEENVWKLLHACFFVKSGMMIVTCYVLRSRYNTTPNVDNQERFVNSESQGQPKKEEFNFICKRKPMSEVSCHSPRQHALVQQFDFVCRTGIIWSRSEFLLLVESSCVQFFQLEQLCWDIDSGKKID